MESSKYQPSWETLRKYLDLQADKPGNGWEKTDDSTKILPKLYIL